MKMLRSLRKICYFLQIDGTTPTVTIIMGLFAKELLVVLSPRLQYPRQYPTDTAQLDILVSV